MKDSIDKAIVMATTLEAAPFLGKLTRKKVGSRPFKVYEGEDMVLVISGIGKVPAAAATTWVLDHYEPNRLFNLGAAGALRCSFEVGDICEIDKAIEYDRPHLLEKGMRFFDLQTSEEREFFTLATQDVPVLAPERRKDLSEHADLVDMEGAAVVQVCEFFETPVSLFKIVTDTPDHTEDKDIIGNVKLTREKLFRFFMDSVLPHFD